MFNIKITQEPIVFFDCSYYIFHRYFATKRWISFQKNAENINFLEAFERHFENDIQRSLCVNPLRKLIYYKPGKRQVHRYLG